MVPPASSSPLCPMFTKTCPLPLLLLNCSNQILPIPAGEGDSCGKDAEGPPLTSNLASNKTPEFGLLDEHAKIKMLCVTHSGLSKTLCGSPWMETKRVLQTESRKKQNIAELMFSLYCLASLCGTLNQIVWVSELGGLYKFIEGNGGEVKRELEVILKRLFLPEAQGHAV